VSNEGVGVEQEEGGGVGMRDECGSTGKKKSEKIQKTIRRSTFRRHFSVRIHQTTVEI
jgi:hypothetical protein